MVTLAHIVSLLEVDCVIEHDCEIAGVNTLKDATETEISFLNDRKYKKELETTKAKAVILNPKDSELLPEGVIGLVTDEPYLKMALVTKLFAKPYFENDLPAPVIGNSSTISPKATIENGATVGENCTIFPGVYIGARAKVGDNSVVYPNSVIYRDCVVGNNCIIHANSVIGSDGYGFAHTKTGEHVKIYQNGNVVVEEGVEIGSNVSIDRAVFGTTLIKRGTKIDNLVQIGHNCVIGENCLLVSQVGISGSSELGRNVIMAGQSATTGHVKIAPFTTLAGRAAVTADVEKSGTYAGFPLTEYKKWLKGQIMIKKLSEENAWQKFKI